MPVVIALLGWFGVTAARIVSFVRTMAGGGALMGYWRHALTRMTFHKGIRLASWHSLKCVLIPGPGLSGTPWMIKHLISWRTWSQRQNSTKDISSKRRSEFTGFAWSWMLTGNSGRTISMSLITPGPFIPRCHRLLTRITSLLDMKCFLWATTELFRWGGRHCVIVCLKVNLTRLMTNYVPGISTLTATPILTPR